MGKTSQQISLAGEQIPHTALAKGMKWGLIGGLSGTMVMDLALMGTFLSVGLPVFTCFSIVGDTVARFFSMLGIEMASGIPTGAIAHYLVGPMVGVVFGGLVTQVEALRIDTLKKSIVIAVLYVEILSQPILATAPLLLKMTAAETWQWFGGSSVMHLVLGIVLGVVMNYGLRNNRSSRTKATLNC